VRGKLQPDMEKLNLRLRIVEPEGAGLSWLSCASDGKSVSLADLYLHGISAFRCHLSTDLQLSGA
jgi:hypothetical protein